LKARVVPSVDELYAAAMPCALIGLDVLREDGPIDAIVNGGAPLVTLENVLPEMVPVYVET
jgi:hypothetical protein